MTNVISRLQPASSSVTSGQEIKLSQVIDVTDTGYTLGSYGSKVTWNPAVLQYVRDEGGGFKSAAVNRLYTSSGSIRYAAADPYGKTGAVTVFTIVFKVVGAAGSLTLVDLSQMSVAATYLNAFKNLLPLTIVQDAEVFVTA